MLLIESYKGQTHRRSKKTDLSIPSKDIISRLVLLINQFPSLGYLVMMLVYSIDRWFFLFLQIDLVIIS